MLKGLAEATGFCAVTDFTSVEYSCFWGEIILLDGLSSSVRSTDAINIDRFYESFLPKFNG